MCRHGCRRGHVLAHARCPAERQPACLCGDRAEGRADRGRPSAPHAAWTGRPVGRVYELDGQVLLLGAGHDANTTIHLAETLAGVRYRRQKFLTLLERGQVIRLTYDEVDHCCEKFDLVDEWLDKAGMQRRGRAGYGEARASMVSAGGQVLD